MRRPVLINNARITGWFYHGADIVFDRILTAPWLGRQPPFWYRSGNKARAGGVLPNISVRVQRRATIYCGFPYLERDAGRSKDWDCDYEGQRA
jgi:hypothetical protein